ncbi:MAG TPA: hypothetical protein VG347_18570 [Verrucomicrobiae bacterium]|nr:hypothetical protein [Verrucomicrobiae bacterium]
MFQRTGKILVIAALVLTTGAHWMALQTVAWTTMIAANWSTGSFSAAVSNTFDGRHLCPLCKAIAAAKKSEQKKESISPTLKLEFPPAAEQFVWIAPKSFCPFPVTHNVAENFSKKPPVPPPRIRFV